MKKIYVIMLIVMMLFGVQVYADNEISPYIEGENMFNETVDNITSGGFTLNPSKIINNLVNTLTKESKQSLKTVLILILISVLSSVVNVLSSSFGEKTSSEAAFFACFTLMSGLSLQCFATALSYSADVIRTMTDFITKLTPVFILTVAASGNPTTATAFQPVLSGAVYIISLLIENTLLPLVVFSAVLGVAGGISDKVQITNFCKVVRSITKWLMAAVITIFTGISAIYGFNAPAFDAMGAKTVKFAIGSLVPVVGGFLSDTLETIIGGAKLMKNAVGTAGIIAILGISILPVVKIFVIQLSLKISAAIAEPVTDKRISKMLWEISESVTTLFGIVIMGTVLFIINISLIIVFTLG